MSAHPFSRRELLRAAAATGLALSIGGSLDATPPIPISLFEAEAARLTEACLRQFWDRDSQMFRAPVLSAEAVPSEGGHDRGYTLWPSLIALQALVEGEKRHPGRYAPQIAMVYAGLEQYYSPDLRAYTAWLRFPGNRDAYYDDNAWAVIALVEASHACRHADPPHSDRYLARAKIIMAEFLVMGYDNTGHPGGMRWGADPAQSGATDRGACSTGGSALAALLLARAGVETTFYTRWGLDLLAWLTRRLCDSDGLAMDAVAEPGWTVRRVKWTYNTGTAMRAYAEHYRLTRSLESRAYAEKLAHAALHRNGALFDQAPHDADKRFYWDETYFVHSLVDGLQQVAQITSDTDLAAAVTRAVARSARYAHTFLRDSADGFYWRNWRLYAIGEAQHRQWQAWTGQTIAPAYDASERSQAARFQSLPVSRRPLVKTLLANGGAARLFWLASRLPPG